MIRLKVYRCDRRKVIDLKDRLIMSQYQRPYYIKKEKNKKNKNPAEFLEKSRMFPEILRGVI